MANTNAPFGFLEYNSTQGTFFNGGLSTGQILYSYATQIFAGDPVDLATTGLLNQGTADTTQIYGVFRGCKYYSTAAKQPVWSRFWPAGSPSGTLNGEGYVITNPNATFLVQTGNSNTTASPATQANVGMTATFAIGTGNTTTGASGAYLDLYQAGNVGTQPFKIIALASSFLVAGSPGSDDTTAYNWVLVGFNYQYFRSLDGHS